MTTTRIREIRKHRGLTLQELADTVGTTAQTIQRLETDNMSVSVDWLCRIGKALDLAPGELITADRLATLRHVGDACSDGIVLPGRAPGTLALTLPAGDHVAVQMADGIEGYPEGSILIGERLAPDERFKAHGRDCIVALSGDRIVLRRAVKARGGEIALRPIAGNGKDAPGGEITWLAVIVMTVRYVG